MDMLNILIAEDEALVAMGLAEMLENIGHRVAAKARNGAEAVELAKKFKPDLAFVDIRMPGMDGLTAASQIIKDRPIPVIILTAFSDEDLIREADEIGVAAYLTKPVTETALRPALILAMSRFNELQMLKHEVGSLKDALESRKLVERAKGIIMEKQKLGEADAFKLLQQQSSKRNLKLAELSRLIVEASDFF